MINTLHLQDFKPEDLRVSNPERNLHHVFEEEDCNALWTAYAAGRPLLVRGAPGSGKSQMARAIAEQLGWGFVKEVINGSTELSDLHWHFDAVARLAEAQVQANATDREARLDPLRFLSPGGFWWAYDWPGAEGQYEVCKTRMRAKPQRPGCQQWQPDTGGVVFLLDEIDKAQPDLPNGLLETLGDRSFTVPYLSSESCSSPSHSPLTNPVQAQERRPVLVVITTNEERELPQAFLRRCFVHTLRMADRQEPETLQIMGIEPVQELQQRYAWLIKRGQLHFGAKISTDAYVRAAELVWQDRHPGNRYSPGLAEYIDLLRVLATVDAPEQCDRLAQIGRYALNKELDT